MSGTHRTFALSNFLCRVCLKHSKNHDDIINLDIIYDLEEQLTYKQCFKICTNVDLTAEELLCKCCALKLQICYDFKKKVEESGAILLQQQILLNPDETINNESIEFMVVNDDKELNVDFKPVEEKRVANKIITEKATNGDCIESPPVKPTLTVIMKTENTETSDDNLMVGTDQKIAVGQISPMSSCSTTTPAKLKSDNKLARRRSKGEIDCTYCGKTFPNHSRMLKHRNCHEPDRPKFPCGHCDRIYATKHAMDCHVRSVHMKTGYKCPICNKIYAIKKGLEIHIRYHTRDFPFICNMCGKKFAQLCHLKTHNKVKHNVMRFKCEFPNCDKVFTSSSSLRCHEFSHTFMPFECELCKRGFPSKGKLKLHIRRKHDKELPENELETMRKFHITRSKLNLIKVTNDLIGKCGSEGIT